MIATILVFIPHPLNRIRPEARNPRPQGGTDQERSAGTTGCRPPKVAVIARIGSGRADVGRSLAFQTGSRIVACAGAAIQFYWRLFGVVDTLRTYRNLQQQMVVGRCDGRRAPRRSAASTNLGVVDNSESRHQALFNP